MDKRLEITVINELPQLLRFALMQILDQFWEKHLERSEYDGEQVTLEMLRLDYNEFYGLEILRRFIERDDLDAENETEVLERALKWRSCEHDSFWDDDA